MLYQQRNEQKRQEFQDKLDTFDDGQIVWVDECGLNRELYRLYGRSQRGQRIVDETSGDRIVPRINMIVGYCEEHLLALFRFNGHTDSVVFNLWVGKCLLSELKSGQAIASSYFSPLIPLI